MYTILRHGIKTFYAQLSSEFILLINVKMPTIGILTFINMINTASESFKARTISIFQHFSFYEQLKFQSCSIELISFELSMKKVYNLGARLKLTELFSLSDF